MGTFEVQDKAGGIALTYHARQCNGQRDGLIQQLFRRGRPGQRAGSRLLTLLRDVLRVDQHIRLRSFIHINADFNGAILKAAARFHEEVLPAELGGGSFAPIMSVPIRELRSATGHSFSMYSRFCADPGRESILYRQRS